MEMKRCGCFGCEEHQIHLEDEWAVSTGLFGHMASSGASNRQTPVASKGFSAVRNELSTAAFFAFY